MKKVTGGALPAIAWHEFMVAAHEGVPVAQLPGGWSAASAGVASPEPLVDVGASEPAPKPVRAIVPTERVEQPVRKAAVPDETASIRRPLADVGGKRSKRETSILDVILGSGQ